MAGKLGNKFVALCSVAVGAIYAAGYAVTDSSQSTLAQNNASKPATGIAAAQGAQGGSFNQTVPAAGNNAHPNTASVNSSSTATTSDSKGTSSSSRSSSTTVRKTTVSTKKPSPPPPPPRKYLDGTYNGSGSNNIGTVYVAVTIKQGKIANVQITQCDTHYDESLIDPVLPQQVISTQSPNVQIVSGATKSTMDFENAVYEALSQAQNPKYTGTGQ